MFGLSIIKLIISEFKTHYRYGILHRLVIKIIMTNSRIRWEQNSPPSIGLLLKYIVNYLFSSLTQKAKQSRYTPRVTQRVPES